MSEHASLRIGLLGFGEVGKRFGADLRARGVGSIATFDLLLDDSNDGPAMHDHAGRHGIALVRSAVELAGCSDLIICAVTAAQALNAVQSVARTSLAGKWLLDVNSASPATKAECGRIVEHAGGRYVESAVMTSVPPYGVRVPMLLGGVHAQAFNDTLTALGFDAKVASSEIGVASAIKLCRSVVIKGMESLVIESFTAARAFGVEQHVLASLKETFPQMDWERQGDYYFSRVIQHGKRRAEEMQASAETVASRGIGGTMAEAASRRQAFISEQRREGAFSDPLEVKPWRERADELLRAVREK
jgi:3-hydroxyisobutyrate dehydrogenase-like beta-hydroxyacid dehydrogenase